MIVLIFMEHQNKMRAFPSVKEMCRHLPDISYYYFCKKRLSDMPTIYKSYAIYKLNYGEYFRLKEAKIKKTIVSKSLKFLKKQERPEKEKRTLNLKPNQP